MNDGNCEDQDTHQVKDKYKIKQWQMAFKNIKSDYKPFFLQNNNLLDDPFQKFEIVYKFNEKL